MQQPNYRQKYVKITTRCPSPGQLFYLFTRALPFQILHTISSSAGWA